MWHKAVLCAVVTGSLCVVLAGCSTLKGIGKTMGCTGGCVAQMTVGEGIAQDAKAAKNWIVRSDEWFRENYW